MNTHKKRRRRAQKKIIRQNQGNISVENLSSLQVQEQKLDRIRQSIDIVYLALLEDFENLNLDNFSQEVQSEQEKQLQSYKQMIEEYIYHEERLEKRIQGRESLADNTLLSKEKSKEDQQKENQQNLILSNIEDNFSIQRDLQSQLDDLYSQMEDLHLVTETNNSHEIDDENDLKYKPGIYNQTKAFLEAEDTMFCLIEEQLKHIDIYNKIAGYD